VGVGSPEGIDNRHFVGLLADGVDDERIVLEMADRLAVPGRRRIDGMIAVEPDPADLMIALINDDDAVPGLEEFDPVEQVHDLRYARWPAGIVGRKDMLASHF